MKKVVISLAVIILLSFGAGIFLLWSSRSNKNQPTEEDVITQAITRAVPMFSDGDKPVIEISSITKFEDAWYIININSHHKANNDVLVYLVLHGFNNDLQVVVGPDTYFNETEMLQYNIPDSIIKELSVS